MWVDLIRMQITLVAEYPRPTQFWGKWSTSILEKYYTHLSVKWRKHTLSNYRIPEQEELKIFVTMLFRNNSISKIINNKESCIYQKIYIFKFTLQTVYTELKELIFIIFLFIYVFTSFVEKINIIVDSTTNRCTPFHCRETFMVSFTRSKGVWWWGAVVGRY